MNKIKIEKRELIEQQRKIFEAGAQRADKRTGSFSFLTWSFFIAPLIAGEESPAATLKLTPAEAEHAKAAQANVALQVTNDDSPASDFSKTSAEKDTATQPGDSLEARAAHLDPTGLLTQLPHEDASKPSIASNEPVAAASGGGGGGGSSDDSDSRSHDGHISIDQLPINWLTADSHLDSEQLPGWSMLDSAQSNVLGDFFGASIPGFGTWLGGVSYLSNDVVGGIAPVQSLVQPAFAMTTDIVGTLANDVVGPIATLETAGQPVLATVTDTLGTLTNDVVGPIATLEATVQPTLATGTDTLGTLTNDVVGPIATLEATVQPTLATVTDTLGTLTNDVVSAIATLETMAQPVLAAVTDTLGTLTNDVVGTMATLETTAQPMLATVSDTIGTLASDVVGTIAPAEAAAQTLLAAGTDAVVPVVADAVSLDAPVFNDVADLAHVNQLMSEAQSQVPDLFSAIPAEPVSTALNAVDPIVVAGSSGVQANDPLHAVDLHAPAPVGAIVDGVDALAPAPGSDADSNSPAVADASHVAAAHVGSSVLVSGAVTPLLPELDDSSQAAAPETNCGLTNINHVIASAAPVVDTGDPLLAAMTSQPTTPSQTAASDGTGAHTPESSASPVDLAETAPVTGSGLSSDVAQPGNLAADALANAAAIGDTIEPVLASNGISLGNSSTNLLQPDVEDSGTGQSAGPADTLLALATATDAPIEVPASAPAPEASAAPDVSNATTAADASSITGDVITLHDAPQPPANVLFNGAQYTDYGVTLSSDIVVAQQQAVSPNDTASDHDSLVQVVGDVQQHAPSPPDVGTTHSIDHLGLRDAIL